MEQSTALAFLDSAKSAEALPAIRKLQDHYGGRDTVIEGRAIEARARLEEEPSVPDLEAKLENPAVSYHAARALVAQLSGPPDDALLDKLIEASRRCYGSYFEQFMELIRDCGHPKAHDRVRAVLGEKAPGLVLRILGKSEGWSAERLGTLAADCGLLASTPTQAQLKAAEELCEEPENLDDLAAAILHTGGCLIEFDLETDEVPPNYPDLIEELAGISGGQITPEDIKSEVLPGDDGACRITFHSGGRSYDFRTEGLGDWIDEVTVLGSGRGSESGSGSEFTLHPLRSRLRSLLEARPEKGTWHYRATLDPVA